MITLCARHMGERTTAALALRAVLARMPRPREPPRGENSLARIWHSYLIFAALRLLAAAGQTGCFRILAGHRVSCCWRQGGFCVRAGRTGGLRHRSPTSPGPGRAPGLTCGFWWQVQDSNLGRLSSAILQTRRENGVTCGVSPRLHPMGTPWEQPARPIPEGNRSPQGPGSWHVTTAVSCHWSVIADSRVRPPGPRPHTPEPPDPSQPARACQGPTMPMTASFGDAS
jgi:hypothetical protein